MKSLTLRERLISVLLLAGLVPLVITVFVLSYSNAGSTKQKELDLLGQTTEYVRNVFDNFFLHKGNQIEVYANQDVVKTMDWLQMREYLQNEVKRTGSFEKILLLNKDSSYYNTASQGNPDLGFLVSSNDKDPNAKPTLLKARDYWIYTSGPEADINKPSFVSDIMISKSTGAKQIVVATGIYNGSDVLGTVGGSITYEQFSAEKDIVFERLQHYFSGKATLYVITQSGKFLYHKDENYIIHIEKDSAGESQIVSPTIFEMNDERLGELAKKAIAGESGRDNFISSESKEMEYYFYGPIGNTGYSVILSLPEEYIYRNITSSIILTGGLSIFFILLLILFAWWITGKFSNPINKLTRKFEKLADGDLTVGEAVAKASTRYEFDILANSFNMVMEKIKAVITRVHEVSQSIALSADEMNKTVENFSGNLQTEASSVEEVNATIEELAASEENMLTSTEFQKGSFVELNLKARELSDINTNVVSHIKETVQRTANITTKAQSSETEMNEMVSIMQKTAEGSRDMLSIINIINDISDRINLLSLNAAIEAARAGDAGRGFAVVADEISHLADETTSSLKQIDSLIRDNNVNINLGLEKGKSVITMVESILEGNEAINVMMGKISTLTTEQMSSNEQVNSAVGEVFEKSEIIAASISEGKIAIDEIVKSLTAINEMTQHNASGAEELSASAEQLAKVADMLKENVNFFKL